MGQGPDSCGGYDVEYDPYEEGLIDGIWMTKNHEPIRVSKMGDNHIKNSIRLCKELSRTATFENEKEKWENWVDVFEDELHARSQRIQSTAQPVSAEPSKPETPYKPRGKKVAMICHCGTEYEARQADLNRGLGYSCSKSCAAIRRDFGRPKAKIKANC